jgi:hypothetical protein
MDACKLLMHVVTYLWYSSKEACNFDGHSFVVERQRKILKKMEGQDLAKDQQHIACTLYTHVVALL